MLHPTIEEFELCDGGLRHVPTNIRVHLSVRNERGRCTITVTYGDPGPYNCREVIELGGRLLLN